jgi:uncharacterized membrane protein YkvA (DUF1232 family)
LILKISFELSARDITYFRERLKRVRAGLGPGDEGRILEGAARLTEQARAASPPAFVLERLTILERLVEMLRDAQWRLEGRDRARILDALAYFVDPDDMIPDRLPGIGYIDDAIMVELIAIELKHELAAYQDFCAFRESAPRSDAASDLEARREALQARMRRRSRRDRESRRPHGAGTRWRLW